jgi:hypothetical protein
MPEQVEHPGSRQPFDQGSEAGSDARQRTDGSEQGIENLRSHEDEAKETADRDGLDPIYPDGDA